MKKNLISLAVAASVLGGAAVQAGQHVSSDKTGQVLLFPFYNADNGNQTNITITNTTGAAKAIKLRFVEYKNSDEVLDFNLYLSKYDAFAFAVTKDPSGTGAAILTRDNSCTVPALGSPNPPLNGTTVTNADGSITRTQPFTNYQYSLSKDVDSTIERTLTGHLEVIEMGVLNNVGTPTVTDPAPNKTQWAKFVTHGTTGVPANCAGIVAGWDAGAFAGGAGVSAATGGLYGTAYQINVNNAAAFGFEPTAIDDWSVGAVHSNPGSYSPSLTEGKPIHTVYTGDNAATPYVTSTAASGALATSAVLMTESIANEVLVNSVVGGQTDWVVTFPTKRAHVDKAAHSLVVAPFGTVATSGSNWLGSVGTTTKKESPACEVISVTQYDREEQTTTTSGLTFSPSITPTSATICNEVAVIAMGPAATPSAMSVTTGLTNISATYQEGWQTMLFGTSAAKNSAVIGTRKHTGLPAIGFGAYKVNNGAMSFGNASEHKRNTVNVAS